MFKGMEGEGREGRPRPVVYAGVVTELFFSHRLETNTYISLWGNQVSEEMSSLSRSFYNLEGAGFKCTAFLSFGIPHDFLTHFPLWTKASMMFTKFHND